MIRFAIKAAVAGSAVYYIKQEGIWRESDVSLKAYDKLSAATEPYIQGACKQLSIELPKFPAGERKFHTAQRYWNDGVIWTCAFLKDLPENASTWTSETVTAILENPDVKKLLE